MTIQPQDTLGKSLIEHEQRGADTEDKPGKHVWKTSQCGETECDRLSVPGQGNWVWIQAVLGLNRTQSLFLWTMGGATVERFLKTNMPRRLGFLRTGLGKRRSNTGLSSLLSNLKFELHHQGYNDIPCFLRNLTAHANSPRRRLWLVLHQRIDVSPIHVRVRPCVCYFLTWL